MTNKLWTPLCKPIYLAVLLSLISIAEYKYWYGKVIHEHLDPTEASMTIFIAFTSFKKNMMRCEGYTAPQSNTKSKPIKYSSMGQGFMWCKNVILHISTIYFTAAVETNAAFWLQWHVHCNFKTFAWSSKIKRPVQMFWKALHLHSELFNAFISSCNLNISEGNFW